MGPHVDPEASLVVGSQDLQYPPLEGTFRCDQSLPGLGVNVTTPNRSKQKEGSRVPKLN